MKQRRQAGFASAAIVAALLLGSCATDRPEASRTVAMAEPLPRVDHHQHLLSPAAARIVSTPIASETEVPADVADLLTRRARFSADPAQLAPVFAEDVLLYGFGMGGWIRGREAAAQFVSLNFAPGYRLLPISYVARGGVIEVAGYYARGEGETLRRPGNFSMNIVRERDGTLRIAAETPVFPGPTVTPPIDGASLVAMLDAAGVQRAVVLSNAYYFDGLITVLRPGSSANVHDQVRAENDWTAEQVARFPDRLTAFCSFNPLADHAMDELERCARNPIFKGFKLHFGTSGVDVLERRQVERLVQLFTALNRAGKPVLAHLAASPAYSGEHSRIFLDEVLPAAPDIPVIIAHLWGGAGYVDEALEVYADAVAAGHPAARNLYFDLAQIAMVEGRSEENLRRITHRMRQIGFDRLLWGADGAAPPGMPPRAVWEDFRAKMPLTDEEFRMIAGNVLPALR
ncbi:MAG: amidohydrolase family protein [Bryobacteraceae bacterium]